VRTALLLIPVALLLAWVALRAPEREAVDAAPPAVRRVPRALEEAPPPGFRVVSLEVAGICCEGCSGKLYGALLADAEVRAGAVDIEARRVDAVVPESFPDRRLAELLTFGEYVAHPLPAPDPR